MARGRYEILTEDDIEQFETKGVRASSGVLHAGGGGGAHPLIWARLGYREDDPSTWERSSIHMASHEDIDVATFAPKAWQAACELIGGADRVAADKPFPWTDGSIVNLWQDADRPWTPPSGASPGWHVDGGFFRHYLDSPEQGLLAIVLWNDVVHQGGATFAATDSIRPVARFLADHPQGALPGGRTEPGVPSIPYLELAGQCHDFIEATGELGDVHLLHPFVLHAKSQNILRRPRFITNSTLFLAEPMRFNRPDPDDHSPVERAILRALDAESYDFTPTGPRARVESALSVEHERTVLEERERLVEARGA